MDQHQGDKIIDELTDIKNLLQQIESILREQQEGHDASGAEHRGLFG